MIENFFFSLTNDFNNITTLLNDPIIKHTQEGYDGFGSFPENVKGEDP